MENKVAILEKLDNFKLMDVVNNYKQYGYDDTLKNAALDILRSRGINEEDLVLAGNSQSQKYEIARDLGKTFLKSARWTVMLYLLFVTLKITTLVISHYSESLTVIVFILYLLVMIVYLVAVIKSFLDHNNFYRAIGKDQNAGEQILFLFFGSLFFIFSYFYYKNNIREELQLIH